MLNKIPEIIKKLKKIQFVIQIAKIAEKSNKEIILYSITSNVYDEI